MDLMIDPTIGTVLLDAINRASTNGAIYYRNAI